MFSRLGNFIKDFLQLVRKDWLTTGTVLLVAIFVLLIIFSYVFRWNWSGFFGSTTITVTGSPVATPAVPSQVTTTTPPVYRFDFPKTLWDWMELLIVPIVLALGALWFNRAQRKREERTAKEREEERLLQDYYDTMKEMLLEHGLRSSRKGSEVRSVAKARTLAVLREVNSARKTSVMNFLMDAELIGKKWADPKKPPLIMQPQTQENIISLRQANLSWANLSWANLSGANLIEANLNGANLSWANLNGANLNGANLNRAKLSVANLSGANLTMVDFSGADLSGADLTGGDLLGANLNGANLNGANLFVGNLNRAHLNGSKYGSLTKWPDGFDPVKAGAKLVKPNRVK